MPDTPRDRLHKAAERLLERATEVRNIVRGYGDESRDERPARLRESLDALDGEAQGIRQIIR